MSLKQHIIAEFSSPATQALYTEKAREGLFGSEQALIQKFFPKQCSVLDIGCGTGRTTLPLHREGYRVTGIDMTPAMISTAQQIAKDEGLAIEYSLADATQLPFPPESFAAAIFSCQGWTQIPTSTSRRAALREVYRVLELGGHYIFTAHERQLRSTPLFTKQYMRARLRGEQFEYGDRYFTREGTTQKQFIHIPSRREVESAIRSAGFELVYSARAHEIAIDKRGGDPRYYVCRK